jgi:hypothetical protein
MWMARGYIDLESLGLIEERFNIYTQEKGSGWALRLMGDLRKLPRVAPIDIKQ